MIVSLDILISKSDGKSKIIIVHDSNDEYARLALLI